MTRVDDDLKIVIQLLCHIPAKLGGDLAVCEGIVTRNAKVDFISRIQHSDFGALRGSLSFVGLSLAEVSNRGCEQPDGIVEGCVHARCAIDSDGLCSSLRDRCSDSCSRLCLLSPHWLTKGTKKHESPHKSGVRFPAARHRSNILGST